ncbi:MAG: cytochrome b/b6 domain-containing protein, partial [Actinobacteria bacterium]|nr:cytochrome b/b6 domain-containing protein [Actinomycetota bacterium]
MATYHGALRRGLPRTPGGEPWPPAGEAPAAVSATVSVELPQRAASGAADRPSGADEVAVGTESAVELPQMVASDAATRPSEAHEGRGIRRGLPRVAGGEPWPPAATAPVMAARVAVELPQMAASDASARPIGANEAARGEGLSAELPQMVASDAADGSSGATEVVGVRRGLPRVAGGEPWPPADFVAASRESAVAAASASTPAHPAAAASPQAVTTAPVEPSAPAASAAPLRTESAAPLATAPAAASTALVADPRPLPPLPFTPTVFPGAAAFARPTPAPEPKRYGPFTRVQWAGATVVAGIGLLFAAAMVVLAVRWFVSLASVQDFLAAFPGEYHLPESAPVGFPAWLGWQHFFNVFLMVLIIRSGWRVRNEKRPTAFWAPHKNKKGKISLTLWFHQALDVLWLVNGVLFVILLFVSGQWMRIIPTSWEVFPNAASAMLQYISLDWPTENGWVNYNSLQQLAYFTTVFVAAPLAAITGVRMSGVWPKKAARLNKIYPVEWARAVHFPVMLYFVLFIIVHVALVFATGA